MEEEEVFPFKTSIDGLLNPNFTTRSKSVLCFISETSG